MIVLEGEAIMKKKRLSRSEIATKHRHKSPWSYDMYQVVTGKRSKENAQRTSHVSLLQREADQS
jgi:hypothetical protein